MDSSVGFTLNKKFELGDTVKITGGEWHEVGDVGRIVKISPDRDNLPFNVDVDGNTLWVAERNLEMVGGNIYEEDGV